MDVASESAVTDYLGAVLKEAGRIDVLVNNAGITRDGLLVRMKETDWDDVLNINFKGTFNCIKAVTKTMMKQRAGRIINVSSVVVCSGNPGQANYVASKAGIIGLTKGVAKELASRGITANVVAPGYVDTDMTTSLSPTKQGDDDQPDPAGTGIGTRARYCRRRRVSGFRSGRFLYDRSGHPCERGHVHVSN